MVEKIKELLTGIKDTLSGFDLATLKQWPAKLKDLPALLKGLPERLRETDWRALLASLKNPKQLLKVVLPILAGLLVVLLMSMFLFRGDDPPAPTPDQAAVQHDSQTPHVAGFTQVPPPNRPFLFQPLWYWQQGDQTLQGSGFAIQARDGRIIGVTAAAYLQRDRRDAPTAVAWLPLVAPNEPWPSRRRLGDAGHAGTSQPLDVRGDLNLFVLEGEMPAQHLLDPPSGEPAKVGQRLWFPDKDFSAKQGYRWLEGEILATEPGCLVARLDVLAADGSQPGSPVFSQDNGALIGMVVRLATDEEQTTLFINPLERLNGLLQTAASQPMAALNSN